MLERSSSSSHGIRRLPSFRNFEIPQLQFQRFPSNFGRTWSLTGSYRGMVREQRSDDDLERQECERLTEVNEHDEPDIKPEPDETVDPNLVRYTNFHLFRSC